MDNIDMDYLVKLQVKTSSAQWSAKLPSLFSDSCSIVKPNPLR